MTALMILLAAPSGACETDDGPRCATPLPQACAPLYEPTFDNVYTNTLEPRCSQGTGSCHGAAPGQGGLNLSDADTAWNELTGASGDPARVLPADVGCSEVTWRIATTGSDMMPPGKALSEAERCAIEQWIASGAER